jgi:Spermidine/putrescine-binding periplasmic protein
MANETNDNLSVDRRRFLQAASAAGAFTIAGCLGGGGGGGGDGRAPMDIESWPPEDYSENLAMRNWYDDWAEWAMDEFGSEFDVEVSNSGFSSPNQWYSQLQAGNEEIDNIAATTNWVERSIENDFLHEIPVDIMPAWENVSDRIKDASSYQQDGSVYAVPESLVPTH